MSAKLTFKIEDAKLRGLGGKARRELSQVVRTAATNIQRRAVDSIHDGPKTGRIYGAESEVAFTTKDGGDVSFIAGKGRELGDDGVHQASAPGEAPANDKGNLAGSIHTNALGDLASEVVVGAAYGAALEKGTEDGHIDPRPYLEPAVEAERPGFERAAAMALQRSAQ